WWKRKGISVAIISAMIIIFSHIFLRETVTVGNDYLRAAMFMIIAFVFAMLSESNEKAQEILKESEKKYKDLVEKMTDVIYTLDTEGRVTSINRAVKTILGREPEEVIGRNFAAWVHQEKLPRIIEVFEQVLSGNNITTETIMIDRDGQEHQVEFSSTPIIKENKVLGTQGIIRDITERKRAEKERARLATAVSHAAEAIMITEPDGSITYVNPAFEDLSGYKREEVLGKKSEILKFSRSDGGSCNDIWSLPARGEVWRGQLTLTGLDDFPYELRVTISPIRDDSGEIVSFVTMMRDVSPEIALERMVHQKQKMEAIGTLAGGIAHDFNNVLGLILGYIELAHDKVDTDGIGAWNCLGHAFEACSRAKDLIRQIITFSRDMEVERIPVNLDKQIKEAVKFIKATFPQTIDIRQNIEVKSAITIADPTQIHQMLINLCTNAAQAMENGKGGIEIGLEEVLIDSSDSQRYNNIKPGNYLRLNVSDTGQGIDPSIINCIFDPYFTTREKGKGSGLGLAVVHGIVTNYGGAIAVNSLPGKGAKFSIFLPKTDTEDEKEGIDVQSILTGNERILFIDDEEGLLNIARNALGNLGYEVITASSGAEALAYLQSRANGIDIVIADQIMPQMTGSELAVDLMKIRPEIPVIICTGFSEMITPERARDLGIREILYKPVSMRELARVIRSVLDKN
ncbi:MAG: PAS domain S-box protein, partial [Deltaproteobacteria bacterium]